MGIKRIGKALINAGASKPASAVANTIQIGGPVVGGAAYVQHKNRVQKKAAGSIKKGYPSK